MRTRRQQLPSTVPQPRPIRRWLAVILGGPRAAWRPRDAPEALPAAGWRPGRSTRCRSLCGAAPDWPPPAPAATVIHRSDLGRSRVISRPARHFPAVEMHKQARPAAGLMTGVPDIFRAARAGYSLCWTPPGRRCSTMSGPKTFVHADQAACRLCRRLAIRCRFPGRFRLRPGIFLSVLVTPGWRMPREMRDIPPGDGAGIPAYNPLQPADVGYWVALGRKSSVDSISSPNVEISKRAVALYRAVG